MRTPRTLLALSLLAVVVGCGPSTTSTPQTQSTGLPRATTQRVCGIAAKLLGINASDVKPTTSLADLAADDLDLVELVMELEDEFNVDIPYNAITDATGENDWKSGFDKITMSKLAQIVNAEQ